MTWKKSTKSDRKSKRLAKLHKQGKLVLGVRVPKGAIPANPDNQAQPESLSVKRYYRDTEFVCRGCEKTSVWTAAQQKRYFEDQKGNTYNTATWCTPCHKIRMAEIRARQE